MEVAVDDEWDVGWPHEVTQVKPAYRCPDVSRGPIFAARYL
jgi:hypothetical protein